MKTNMKSMHAETCIDTLPLGSQWKGGLLKTIDRYALTRHGHVSTRHGQNGSSPGTSSFSSRHYNKSFV